ncbi:hypothetical protein HanXRQr2_Chr10g0429001 [Helianthus annuus]|uniref:Uncharacterized protein n=1 Tax=Helianthus annuus TaxID=4232 RepID=A0A251TGN3_HELAN|nr:hypothetical protein HanXRQr2_Chr10g0429001 [Helianthus annuus]
MHKVSGGIPATKRRRDAGTGWSTTTYNCQNLTAVIVVAIVRVFGSTRFLRGFVPVWVRVKQVRSKVTDRRVNLGTTGQFRFRFESGLDTVNANNFRSSSVNKSQRSNCGSTAVNAGQSQTR